MKGVKDTSGKASQRKGADGERELAAVLREYGYERKSQHIFAKKIKKFQTQAAKAVEKTASADRKPRISRG